MRKPKGLAREQVDKIGRQIYLCIGVFMAVIFAVVNSPILSRAEAAKDVKLGDTVSGISKSGATDSFRFTLTEGKNVKIKVAIDPYQFDESDDAFDDSEDSWDEDWDDSWEDDSSGDWEDGSDYGEEDGYDEASEVIAVTCSLKKADGPGSVVKSWKVEDGKSIENTFSLKAGKYELSIAGDPDLDLNYKVTFKDVTVYAAKITIPAKLSMQVGETKKLKVSLTPKNSQSKGIVWKTSNKKVATVSKTGDIKGVSKGSCTVSAVLKGGNTVKCTVTVKAKVQKAAKK